MARVRSRATRWTALGIALASSIALGSSIPAHAGESTKSGDDAAELLARFNEMDAARTAPTGLVAPGAYSAAVAQLSSLPAAPGAWTEITKTPYNADDPRYRDPGASNSSGGAGYVSGRVQAVVTDTHCIFAGGAAGGVNRSCDGGTSWAAISDTLPTQSIGYLRIAPDGALWVATGDGTTGSGTFVGTGVYRLASPDSGTLAPTDRVGGTELESQVIRGLTIDAAGNRVFAAGSRGVYAHSLTGSVATPWTNVLAPCKSGMLSCTDVNSNYWDIANDVAVQPGTAGKVVLANVAWRSGAAYNGFYLSKNAGATWTKVNPGGAINPKDIGNSTFAYGADGTHLYVVVESPHALISGAASVLQGVYVSTSGNVAGPYNLIANSSKFAQSGSAERKQRIGGGYQPGVQAWYNQFAGVDPANPKHVYIGLEEVYESFNAGATWNAVGRYWNFGFACWSNFDSLNTCDGNVVHSDQHSIAFGSGSTAGQVLVGNDGGLYSRSIKPGTTSWKSLTRSGQLDQLQYYSVAVGKDVQPGAPAGSVQVWGGLQDNGGSLLLPGATKMVSPFGGDGGDIIVDPEDGCRILDEYVYLTLWLTTNCGTTDGSTHAVIDVSVPDPNPRFTAPFRADSTNKDHWVAGGQKVWTYDQGFALTDGIQWQEAFDTGTGHSITGLESRGDVVYAGWCGPCNADGFKRGIATNYGGTWHQLALPADLPNRYVSNVVIDPNDADRSTAYAVLNGFSRRWTDGPGAGVGHLWRTTDGGATWADVSAGLPDVPADDLIVTPAGGLVLGTDLGVVYRAPGSTSWQRLGGNHPYTTVMDLHLGPDGLLYSATHGRGIWSIPLPS